jgi:hypothetical protein
MIYMIFKVISTFSFALFSLYTIEFIISNISLIRISVITSLNFSISNVYSMNTMASSITLKSLSILTLALKAKVKSSNLSAMK